MQTFLPYFNFWEALECLDNKREGKQRIEALIILKVNKQGPKIAFIFTKNFRSKELLWFAHLHSGDGIINTPWYNHPACRMWHGYDDALRQYYNISIQIWIERGFNNAMRFEKLPEHIEYPSWLGDKQFHASHRSNLLRKNPAFYGQYGWTEPDNLPYVWPV